MNKKGFTLVEVIATVALLAILIGLASTSLIKKYNESKREAIIIQEGQLVQSGDMVIQDYCKDPLNEGYQLQCDNYYQSYEDSNDNLIIEDNMYTKYICVKDLKKLGYYSEELVYSGVDCSGVVIYKIDYETDLQKDSYSVIKCGEDYTTEVENAEEYLINFKECFDTPSGGGTGEGETEVAKEYLLTVNFTELTPNGMKVGQSHSKKYKKGDPVTVSVPAYSTVANDYTPFKHGSSVNANNFNLSDDKTKLNGTMPEGNVTVNIVYSASTYVLTVNYKEFNNVQGNITFPSKQFIMFYGEKIEIPYETKENFKVISPSDFTYEMEQSDDEIDVVYQQEKFNLTYNSNGGTACSSRQVIYNKVYGSLCSPTRTGYTFDGWYLNGEKVETTDINDNYSNITLTAKWIANKYVVIYNCNGGTPTTNYSSEHTYDQASNLANNQCEKIGSVFGGWKDSNGNTYSNKQSIKNLLSENNSSITLIAQWSPLIYYVTFAANSGSGTMSKMTVTYGHVVNLTKNTFTRTGHRFDGWSGSDGKTYADREAISNLTTVHGSTITMTAKWTKCGAGTYLVNNVCTACAAGTYSTGGVNSCTACPAGKYTSSTGQGSCSTCAAGTYNTGTGNTSCKSCDVGYYCTGGANKTACPAGKYSTGGASTCSTCTAGYYCPGASNRVACAAGKYNSNTGSTAASACTNCSAGYYSAVGASSCTGCPAGKYSTAGSSTCTTCTAGYYCPGSSNRVACAAGKYNSNTGSTAASACTNCSAGYYSAAGASSCTGCPAGKYSAAGSSTCTTCTAGYYCPGSSNRVACAAGKYNSNTGSTASSACTNCSAGYYSSAGSSSCSACAAGKYSTAGSSTCTTCPANYYCPGASNKIACAFGYESPEGSDAASDCYVASSLPTLAYTGSFQVVKDDDTAISNVLTNTTFIGTDYSYSGTWKIRFLTSGTLKFTSLGTGASGIDIFLVGGGGSGGTGGQYKAQSSRGGGGGGGGSTTNVTKFPATVGTSYTLNIASAAGSSNWKVGSTTYYNTNGGKSGCSPTYTNGSGYNSCAGSGGELVNHSNNYGATKVESRKGSSGGSGGSGKIGNDGEYEFYGSSGKRYGAGGGAGGGGSSTGTGSGYSTGKAGGTTGGGKGGTGCDYENLGGWTYVNATNGTAGTANTGSGGGGGGGSCGSGGNNYGHNASGASGGTGIIIIRNTR